MVVKHHALHKFLAAGARKLAHSCEIARGNGGRELYLDPDDLTLGILQHDVDLGLVLGPKMRECAALFAQGRDLWQFAEHEVFQDRIESGFVLANYVMCHIPHCCEQARIKKVKFVLIWSDASAGLGSPG